MRRCFLAIVVLGCGSSNELRVDLRSDFTPVIEASEVTTRIWRTEARNVLLYEETRIIPNGSALFDGLRVAVARISTASVWVDVELFDPFESTLASRSVAVRIEGNTGVTVLLTRNCAGVVCPLTDLSATQCVGGQCAQPGCSPERPDLCPDPVCANNSACPMGAACAESVCVDGVCLLRPRDDECLGAVCHPEDGCIAGMDAGVDAGVDASTDVGVDASGDAGMDVGTDGGPDVGTDVGLDSADACSAICPGTCVAGTCQIDDPFVSTTCPAGIPCAVRCTMPGSCPDVNCGSATDCSVECDGPNTCVDVNCSRGSCTLGCNGANSCATVRCDGSQCQATCDGTGACAQLLCSGDCQVDCAADACGVIDCRAACRCEAMCSGGVCSPAAMCPPGCQDGTQCRDMAGCDMCP